MRRHSLPLLLGVLLCITTVASADGWQKFVSQDGSFSFHHPVGWTAVEQPSNVIVESGDGRQLSIISLPYQAGQTAEQHARQMLALLAVGNPGIEATNWRAEGGDLAYAEVSFTENGAAQAGDVLVIRDANSQQALWFGYTAPAAGYDRVAALEMLRAVMESLAVGDASQPPGGELALSDGEQKIVTAFLFTLEFALGAPLDLESEQIIARELAEGLEEQGQTFAELSMYPPLAQQIMSLDQEQLDELQKDLHSVLNEWINENDPNDPAVGIVRERMDTRGQVVAEADLLLSATAAQSYAELVAYSEVLQDSPDAGVGEIPFDRVRAIRARLIEVWPELTSEQRADIITAPDVWGVLRHAMLLGESADALQARSSIAEVAADAPETVAASDDIRDQMSHAFIYGETLRMMQQHTFNTWRWSMGYCMGPMGF